MCTIDTIQQDVATRNKVGTKINIYLEVSHADLNQNEPADEKVK